MPVALQETTKNFITKCHNFWHTLANLQYFGEFNIVADTNQKTPDDLVSL